MSRIQQRMAELMEPVEQQGYNVILILNKEEIIWE